MESYELIVKLALLVIGAYLLYTYQPAFKPKYPEPPVISSKLPLLGHIIQLLRRGSLYLSSISEKRWLPIYTLPVFTGRLYVVNDASLASAIHRRTKDFSFDPFVTLAAERLAGTTREGMKLVRQDTLPSHLTKTVIGETHDRLHKILGSRADLERMGRSMATSIAVALNRLDSVPPSTAASQSGSETINLQTWARQTICAASTDTVYGPMNPFAKDSRVEKWFWDYEAGLSALLVHPIPQLTAPRAYHGRESVARAFREYFRADGWKQSSALIQESYRSNTAMGVSIEDQARFELTTCIGLLVNAIPAVSWMLFHILSDRELLNKIRAELEASVSISRSSIEDSSGASMEGGDTASTRVELPIMDLRSSCPLLNSTLKEVLRIHSTSLSARVVTRETTLGGKFSLKRGSVVQIPGAVTHRDESQWGPDAREFDPARFVPQGDGAQDNSRVPRQPSAFRAYGGGTTLCPGRHFATIEILVFVAMFVLQFDAEVIGPNGRSGGGEWTAPEPKSVNLTTSIMPAPKEMPARLRRRRGFERVEWILG